MERGAGAAVATFYAPQLTSAGELTLTPAAAHHASVRRLAVGDDIRLTNGAGTTGVGTITRLGKGTLVARVDQTLRVPPHPLLELFVPVADRDRMLWLAEKAAELGVSVWQPVMFARSRSVVPRGEGPPFAAKVNARMVGALEQSGGAWLPEVRSELSLPDAVAAATAADRFVLEEGGDRFDVTGDARPAAVLFGPEGGIDPAEREIIRAAGWRPVRLATSTLRFETAGLAAVAILRARAVSAPMES